eukprot:354601-Chlamydomonas_euryale.AAC.1
MKNTLMNTVNMTSSGSATNASRTALSRRRMSERLSRKLPDARMPEMMGDENHEMTIGTKPARKGNESVAWLHTIASEPCVCTRERGARTRRGSTTMWTPTPPGRATPEPWTLAPSDSSRIDKRCDPASAGSTPATPATPDTTTSCYMTARMMVEHASTSPHNMPPLPSHPLPPLSQASVHTCHTSAKPMIAPMLECVVETAISKYVATVTQIPAAASAHIMPYMYSSGN